MVFVVPGYNITKKLKDGVDTIVFRAMRNSDEKVVALKVVKEEHSHPRVLAKLLHEHKILKRINSPFVLKTYGVEHVGPRIMLVLEYFESTSLDFLIAKRLLDLSLFLSLSVSIAQAVSELHHHGVLHKNIRPSNFLVDITGKDVKIIDFEFAIHSLNENQEGIDLKTFYEIMPYMSLEQRQGINRPTDNRSDIYSLGVTLYEMATNQLPYLAGNDKELVQMQMTSKPIPPHVINEGVPEAVSEIIMKCIEIDADDRYQNILGLSHDLEKCLQDLDKGGVIHPFQPGQADLFSDFRFPSKLYARENELYELQQTFWYVCEKEGDVVFVEGPSGSGKTTLVKELQKDVITKNGMIVWGQCEQNHEDVPFYSLIQVFRKLLKHLLDKDEEETEVWKQRISNALGFNGGVLTYLLPELEAFIGPQPAVFELDIMSSEQRLFLLLVSFFESLVTPENPLVILLDDVQWADESTRKVLEFFLEGIVKQGLMLVMAYKHETVRDNPRLHKFLDKVKKVRPACKTIQLLPFDLMSIRSIICDCCHVPIHRAEPLALSIKEITRGNQLHTLLLIKQAYEEGAFTYHKETLSWKWDESVIIRAFQGKSLKELIEWKVKKLSDSSLEILKQASVFGMRFSLDILSVISKISPYNTLTGLMEAVDKELLYEKKDISETNIFELVSAKEDVHSEFVFIHPLVQQVVSNQVSDGERTKISLKIGYKKLQLTPESLLPSKILEFIKYLNQGLSKIQTPKEIQEISELNISAGEEAMKRASYSYAAELLQIGIRLLKRTGRGTQRVLMSKAYENLAICHLLIGNVSRSDKYFKLSLSLIQDIHEQSRLYCRKVNIYGNMGDFQRGIEAMKAGLLLYQEKFEFQSGKIATLYEKIRMWLNLLVYGIKNIKTNPEDMDGYWKTSLYAEATYAFFKLGISEQFACKIVNDIFKYGAYEHSTLPVGNLAALYGSYEFQDYKKSEELSGLLLKLGKLHPNSVASAFADLMYTAILHILNEPVNLVYPLLQKSKEECLRIGLVTYTVNALSAQIFYLLVTSEPVDEALEITETLCEEIETFKRRLFISNARIVEEYFRAILGLKEDDAEPCPKELENELNMDDPDPRVFTIYYYVSCKMSLLYLHDHPYEALDFMKKVEPYYHLGPAHPVWYNYHFYRSLSIAKVCMDAKNKENHLRQLQQDLKWIKKLSEKAPFNFLQKYYILAGELARIGNRNKEAIRLYEKAVYSARENGFLRDLALAYELLGKLYYSMGIKTYSEIFLQLTYRTYEKWGALHKLRLIRNEFKEFVFLDGLERTSTSTSTLKGGDSSWTEPSYPSTTTTVTRRSSTKSSTSMTDAFDASAIIKASQVLAGEVVFDKLLSKLLRIVIVNAGADKAILVLVHDEKFYVQAEMTLGQDTATILQSVPLEAKTDSLSVPIVYYTARSKKEVLLEDAVHNTNYLQDDYIQKYQILSLLCLPLIHQGKLSGVLYLENKLTRGAFTTGHLRLLTLLSAQIAISIENAQFYAGLEQKVEERTKELRDMQDQLVQQEKIASLGFLTSGIANEISSPLNFVMNYSEQTGDFVNRLEEQVKEGKNSGVTLSHEIEDAIEALKSSLKKVQENSLRAGGIVKKMLEHSRIQEGKLVATNLHKVIDLAIQTTIEDWKSTDPSFDIVVDTEYDSKIQDIDISPEEIEKMIANLLDNALYSVKEKKNEQGNNYTPEVKVSTKLIGESCEIRVFDNGKGIPNEIQGKIFTPFTTTKPPGKGVGLALSLSYNIATQLHDGNLTFKTKVNETTEFVITLPITSSQTIS